MSAYIILKDRHSKTLTIPQGITALSRASLLNGSVYVGTFWASSWEEAKKFFNVYCGY